MNSLMRFGKKEYQQAFNEYVGRQTTKKWVKDQVKNGWEGAKYGILNATPFMGFLPVSWQKSLRDNKKKYFGKLDYDISTITTPVLMAVLAYEVGLSLDGFDIGGVTTVRKGWYEIDKYYSLFNQLFGFNGFPREVTQVASYTLIVDGISRVGLNLAGKPLGFLPLEGINHLINHASKNSEYHQETEDELQKGKEVRETIRTFTNEERGEMESQLSTLEEELLLEPSSQKQAERDSLLEKLGVPNE